MRLSVDELFEKLIIDDAWRICFQGIISTNGIDINLAKARDVVGNIMQEWLEGWLKKNNIDYAPNPNSQMPPDFYLNPDNLKEDLLEVKAFNYKATPGFDIADFNAYQSELIEKPYMLHSKYLIFGYVMQDDGYVVIKKMWLKNVWEICRPMANWPLNLQVKDKVVHKIRPAKWYSKGRTKFLPFEKIEDFISAMDETVYKNPKTREESGEWLSKFLKSYKKQYDKKLKIPRWGEIEGKYVLGGRTFCSILLQKQKTIKTNTIIRTTKKGFEGNIVMLYDVTGRVLATKQDYGFRTREALVAECYGCRAGGGNAKIHNMEQKLADRELVADLQAMGLTEPCGGVGSADNRRLLNRTEQIEQTMGMRVAA